MTSPEEIVKNDERGALGEILNRLYRLRSELLDMEIELRTRLDHLPQPPRAIRMEAAEVSNLSLFKEYHG